MNEADALEIVQYAIWTVLLASGPAVVVAMFVGVSIALVQALTQIQEITLTFVPKLIVVALSLVIFGGMIMGLLGDFTTGIFERIPDLVK